MLKHKKSTEQNNELFALHFLINMKRQKEIYARLEKKDFAATNLVLGIGSFTYQCVTRDNLGLAMKATYCELEQVDEQGNTTTVKKNIYKDPKTVVGMPKKSLILMIVLSKSYILRHRALIHLQSF